jgi:hypothetical protein
MEQVEHLEVQIKAWRANNSVSQRLASIPGVGVLTASALAATVGGGQDFRNGRQLAAYLGLVFTGSRVWRKAANWTFAPSNRNAHFRPETRWPLTTRGKDYAATSDMSIFLLDSLSQPAIGISHFKNFAVDYSHSSSWKTCCALRPLRNS